MYKIAALARTDVGALLSVDAEVDHQTPSGHRFELHIFEAERHARNAEVKIDSLFSRIF